MAPGPLIASPAGAQALGTGLRSSGDAKVMSFPILPGWLLSFPGAVFCCPCALCGLAPPSTHQDGAPGQAQLPPTPSCPLPPAGAQSLPDSGGQGISNPWGSMGPGSGPAAGRCVGKRVTVTTDKVIKRQNAAMYILPRSFLQSQDAWGMGVEKKKNRTLKTSALTHKITGQ